MSEIVQISAYISTETKARLETLVKSHGLTKSQVVEDALLHHLQTLSELSADIIIPSKLVVSEESLQMIAEALENPPPPTQELKSLWNN